MLECLGAAIEPSFVTCPTRTTAIPAGLPAHQAEAAADLADAPAGPSRSSIVAVWTESMINSAGPGARLVATSAIRSIDDSAMTAIAHRPHRAVRGARREATWAVRFLAGCIETRSGPTRPATPAAPGGGALDLPIPGCRRGGRQSPDQAAPAAIELADPGRDGGRSAPDVDQARGALRRQRRPRPGADNGRGSVRTWSRRGCSTPSTRARMALPAEEGFAADCRRSGLRGPTLAHTPADPATDRQARPGQRLLSAWMSEAGFRVAVDHDRRPGLVLGQAGGAREARPRPCSG